MFAPVGPLLSAPDSFRTIPYPHRCCNFCAFYTTFSSIHKKKCSPCSPINACRQSLPSTRACCCQLFEMSSHLLQSRAPLGKKESSYSTKRFLSLAPERINLHASSGAIYTIRRGSKSTAATLCGSSETRYYHIHVRGGIHHILLRPVCTIFYIPHISLADVLS